MSKVSFAMPVCNLSVLLNLLPQGQCILGLDPGSIVIGVAVSDPGLSVASPLASIIRTKLTADVTAVGKLVRERRAGSIIVGLPKNMDGSEGSSAQSARTFISNLFKSGALPDAAMPVAFWDERLSTAAVERFMVEDNMTRKRRSEVVDKAAAAYILQGALDRLRNLKLSGS